MTEKSDHATSHYHAQHSIAYTATENSDDSLIVHSIVPCVTLAAVVYYCNHYVVCAYDHDGPKQLSSGTPHQQRTSRALY